MDNKSSTLTRRSPNGAEDPAKLRAEIAQTRNEIRKMKTTISALMNLEGQDRQLVAEMAEDMLTDLETGDTLVELSYYVRRYCSVIDGSEEARQIVSQIESHLATAGD